MRSAHAPGWPRHVASVANGSGRTGTPWRGKHGHAASPWAQRMALVSLRCGCGAEKSTVSMSPTLGAKCVTMETPGAPWSAVGNRTSLEHTSTRVAPSMTGSMGAPGSERADLRVSWLRLTRTLIPKPILTRMRPLSRSHRESATAPHSEEVAVWRLSDLSEERTATRASVRAPGAAARREKRAGDTFRGAEAAPGRMRPIATTRMPGQPRGSVV